MKQINKILPILIILTALIISFLPVQVHADGEAWVAGYAHRKQFTITGTADGIMANLQLPLRVYRAAGADGTEAVEGVTGNKIYVGVGGCEADYDDIRVTKADGSTLLDYWIEEYDASDATLWVEYDSIPASPTTINFYIYYGNAGAASYTNGANTFITFDDFERGINGDAVGGSWTIASGDCDISTDHAYGGTRSAKFIGGAAAPTINIPRIDGSTYAVKLKQWKEDLVGDGIYIVNGSATKCFDVFTDLEEDICYYDGSTRDTLADTAADAWKLFEISDIDFTASTFDIWHEGVSIKDDAAMLASGSSDDVVTLFNSDVTAGHDVYVDNFIIRKWTTTNPTFTAWAAEENEGSAPTVTTQAASAISYDVATLNGNITNLNSGGNCTVRGFEYDTNSGAPYASDIHSHGDYGTGAYTEDLTGLIPNTIYYARAYATNPAGTGYGSEINFTTTNNIETQAATGVAFTDATLNAELLDMAADSSYDVSFDYGKTVAYELGNEVADESPMAGIGTFHKDLAALDDGTLYYYRAKGVGDVTGTRYGAQKTFTTDDQSPTVTTDAATGVTMDSAGATGGTFNGEVTDLGDDTGVTYSFQYGLTTGYGTETTPGATNSTGLISDMIPAALLPGNTYHYRAKAVNVHGTSYGSSSNFTFTMPTFAADNTTYVTPGAANATLYGTMTDIGKASNATFYYQWGYNVTYGTNTADQTIDIMGVISQAINSFLRNVTVHWRMVCEVGSNTSYGSDETFLIAPPALAEVLWYEPITIISGTTLPDRDSTEDGIITWGTADLTASLTGFIPPTTPTPTTTSSTGFIPTPTPSGTFGTDVTPGAFPFADIIEDIKGTTPGQIPWMLITGFIILVISLISSWIMRRFGSGTIFIKFGIILAGMAILIGLGVYDFWMIVIFIVVAAALMMASRQQSWN